MSASPKGEREHPAGQGAIHGGSRATRFDHSNDRNGDARRPPDRLHLREPEGRVGGQRGALSVRWRAAIDEAEIPWRGSALGLQDRRRRRRPPLRGSLGDTP